MYRIAIVDDEPAMCESLREGVQAFVRDAGIQAEISVFHDAESFTERCSSCDLVLLDIQLGGMNGMECAEWIRERDQSVQIIFITSMIQYAVQGYKVNALDYIVKPVDSAQLKAVLDKAFRRFEASKPRTIMFRIHGDVHILNISDIIYVEAVNHSAVARTVSADVPCGTTLSAVETQLDSCGFFRCHAGFLINLALVERVMAADVIVAGRTVPVSKHRRSDLMQALAAWWGKNI